MKCANFKRLMARPPPIENINNINPVWLSNDHHNPGVQMIHLHVIRSTQKVFRTGKLLLLQKTIQLVQARCLTSPAVNNWQTFSIKLITVKGSKYLVSILKNSLRLQTSLSFSLILKSNSRINLELFISQTRIVLQSCRGLVL